MSTHCQPFPLLPFSPLLTYLSPHSPATASPLPTSRNSAKYLFCISNPSSRPRTLLNYASLPQVLLGICATSSTNRPRLYSFLDSNRILARPFGALFLLSTPMYTLFPETENRP